LCKEKDNLAKQSEDKQQTGNDMCKRYNTQSLTSLIYKEFLKINKEKVNNEEEYKRMNRKKRILMKK
jgi:hypothetical protein